MPLVCALCLQDAKAHQLKELQCEAAVLEVYTGLYKMTELMQDSRAEVYIGTVGEPSMRAPLACFCLAVKPCCPQALARPARHGILGLQQQVGSQPAHPSHCYV